MGAIDPPPLTFSVHRDDRGIPHVRAPSRLAAFAGQAFAMAEDRFFQMEVDRRFAGAALGGFLKTPSAKAWDALQAKMGMASSCAADLAALKPSTLEMLEAFAAGVNAYIDRGELPPEWAELGLPRPQPWTPVDSLAVFKGRHLTMGTIGNKLHRWKMVLALGPEKAAQILSESLPPLDGNHVILKDGLVGGSKDHFSGPTQPAEGGIASLHPPPDLAASLPPSAWHGGFSPSELVAEFEQLHKDLTGEFGGKWADGFEMGSNCWAVDGRWTKSGLAMLGGDPHRQCDFPNVYYQCHITCPEFDAIGLAFPGVPGFAHFGHNSHVAWCITHAMYSNADLFLEHFPTPKTYSFEGCELPLLFDGAAVFTHHGPLLLGSPEKGWGVSVRWAGALVDSDKAKAGKLAWIPNAFTDALEPMLVARDVPELDEEPQNNMLLLSPATPDHPHGHIRYLNRGLQAIRADQLNLWVPVPGWDGKHEWMGFVPFEALPRGEGGETGRIVTANNPIVGSGWEFGPLSVDYAPEGRFIRIHQLLAGMAEGTITPDHFARIHADLLTLTAEPFLALLLDGAPAAEGPELEALDLLRDWRTEPVVSADAAAPLLYTLLRMQVHQILESEPGAPLAAVNAFKDPAIGADDFAAGWLAEKGNRKWGPVSNWAKHRSACVLPPGWTWQRVVHEAFARAVKQGVEKYGGEVGKWRYGDAHASRPKHAASAVVDEAKRKEWDAKPMPMGGDADTVQAAGGFPEVVLQSVARYVLDPTDNWAASRWIVPLGVSGVPGSPHASDQAEFYSRWEMVPMLFDWDEIGKFEGVEVVV
ncbi:nucleophile aminohydrolase [Hyaloraphidium curvatum]|nr:nucleophile aminohydrolase [Hyaloraphidium curvatum]